MDSGKPDHQPPPKYILHHLSDSKEPEDCVCKHHSQTESNEVCQWRSDQIQERIERFERSKAQGCPCEFPNVVPDDREAPSFPACPLCLRMYFLLWHCCPDSCFRCKTHRDPVQQHHKAIFKILCQ